jgi:hypothetical protein
MRLPVLLLLRGRSRAPPSLGFFLLVRSASASRVFPDLQPHRRVENQVEALGDVNLLRIDPQLKESIVALGGSWALPDRKSVV